MNKELLIQKAIDAMSHAYAPYSGYKVGAALLCADGTIYQGCNIENSAFSPTVCAERTAIFKAVYDGQRDFSALAVCGGKNGVITDFFPALRRMPAGDAGILQTGSACLSGGTRSHLQRNDTGTAPALQLFSVKLK